MQTIKVAFVSAVLLSVAYLLWLATDTILWFVEQAATLALLSVRVCGGLLVAIVAAAILWAFLRQRNERNRQRDGAFALREYWLEPLPRRLLNWLCGRPSARAIYDPNANMSHGAVIQNAVYVVEPAAGWDRQLAYMQDIERTRRTQAALPGDGVMVLPWSNIGKGGVANAPTGRLLAGAYDKQIKAAPTIDQPPPTLALPPPADLSPLSALAAAQPALLVMGQTAAGDLVRWDMTRTPHLRYHGATRGSGKTNAIQAVAAGALASGAHVVVFDRVNLKDWQDFAHCAELVDTGDPARLVDGAMRLLTIYHTRARQLAAAGARDISRMARPPQRVVAVVPEFGAQCETARAAGLLDALTYPLTQLLRMAAAAGVHLVFEDQVAEKWPRGMSANAVPVIGRMPTYAGQACGYIGRGGLTTETFPPYTFAFDGSMFRAPHMEPELRTLLAEFPAPRQLVMLTPAYRPEADRSARSARSEAPGGGGDAPGSAAPPAERPNEQPNERPYRTPAPSPAPASDPGPTDLQTAVWAWRDANPAGSQADMRRHFAARGIEIARGYAHECWHKWPGPTALGDL